MFPKAQRQILPITQKMGFLSMTTSGLLTYFGG
jgi:hypothetical protein